MTPDLPVNLFEPQYSINSPICSDRSSSSGDTFGFSFIATHGYLDIR